MSSRYRHVRLYKPRTLQSPWATGWTIFIGEHLCPKDHLRLGAWANAPKVPFNPLRPPLNPRRQPCKMSQLWTGPSGFSASVRSWRFSLSGPSRQSCERSWGHFGKDYAHWHVSLSPNPRPGLPKKPKTPVLKERAGGHTQRTSESAFVGQIVKASSPQALNQTDPLFASLIQLQAGRMR